MLIKGKHSEVNSTKSMDGEAAGVDNPNQSFRYLSLDPVSANGTTFISATDPEGIRDALEALGKAMVESSDTATEQSTIPTVYTYWGQFIDHDITAGTDRPSNNAASNNGFNLLSTDIFKADFVPQHPTDVEKKIFNLRLPELDLDSVYGGGPEDFETIQEGIFADDKLRLKIGQNVISGFGVTPNPDLPDAMMRDLPRKPDRKARIGDDRNDENTIVAQFHTGWLRFHNAVADVVEADPNIAPGDRYAHTKQLVTWTYQWLVVNDYLKTICKDGIVDEMLYADSTFFDQSTRFMPLEFSVAGFRFGHSMIRAEYDFNENFSPAPFNLLFTFTGLNGNLGGNDQLPNNWIIDWARFTNKHSHDERHFARRIDTNISMSMANLPSEGPADNTAEAMRLAEVEKMLAIRNLWRGYLLSLPTGEHVANFLGVTPLSPSELASGLDSSPVDPTAGIAAKAALESGPLAGYTPLWFYILKEAEIQTNGNCLGEVGSRIVAGTIIGLLKKDMNSYLNAPGGWNPSQGVKLANGKPITRIGDVFKFAGVAV